MTERTVTIQTEEEETITLCDECGLSDDAGEIVTYVPMPAGPEEMVEKGELVGEWNEMLQDYETVHMHRSCLDDMGVDVPEAPTYADVAPRTSVADGTVVHALDRMDRNSILFSIALLCGATYLISNDNLVGFGFAAIIGLVFLAGGLSDGAERAQETIDEIQNNG